MSRLGRLGLVGALTAIAACGNDLGPATGPATLEFLTTRLPADTIEAPLSETVVLSLRAGDAPIKGAKVRLLGGRRMWDAAAPFAQLRVVPVPPGDTPYSTDLLVTTDDDGQIRLQVKYGWHTGADYLLASIPSLDLQDSIPYEITQGRPFQVELFPRDTAIQVGAAFRFAVTVRDRAWNAATATGTVTTDSNAVRIEADGRVVASRFGWAAVNVAAAGEHITAGVSVVPPGVLAGAREDRIVALQTDGKRTWADIPTPSRPKGVTWLRRADSIGFDMAGAIFVTGATGGFRRLIEYQLPVQGEEWPRFIPNTSDLLLTINGSIFRVNTGVPGAQQLSSTGVDLQASPSPDGTRAVLSRGGVVSVMDLVTGAVTSLGAPGYWARWSPNGALIAYTDTDESLWVIGADGSAPRRIRVGGQPWWFSSGLDWSPDSKWLVATAGGPDNGLVLVEVSTGMVLPLPQARGLSYPSWKP